VRPILFSLLAVSLVACVAMGPGASSPANKEPTSDPDEYHDRGLSAEVGREYFEKIGLGDPYRCGLAYPIYLALLRAYPDLFGGSIDGAIAKFGFLPRSERGSDLDAKENLPIGMHLTVDPNTRVPFLVGSCALCHSERITFPDGSKHLVMGLGSKRIRIHAYDAAFVEVASKPDFDASHIEPIARDEARAHGITWPDDYRSVIVKKSIEGLKARAIVHADATRLASGMPGRVATIEGFAMVLGAKPSGPIGWAKIPDVIGFPWRETLSWDGAGTGAPTALVVEADLANGMRPEWLETHRHIGTSLWMHLDHIERKLDFPGPVDSALAKKGQGVFEAHCSSCHGTYDPGVVYKEKIVPVDVVKTDPTRMLALTDEFAAKANAVPAGRGLTHAQRTGGYVPPILLDVFARAPFGHAGQWPSLAVMASKDRPKKFIVDPGAPIDVKTVGVKMRDPSSGPLQPGEYLYDGSTPGLSVDGHPFLADLAEADRTAAIEYLKTL
jgi:hypothetical protein